MIGRDASDSFGSVVLRHMLQRIGQSMREAFGEDFWVDRVRARLLTGGRWVVSDVRYLNEVAMIRDLGGSIIRLNRVDQIPHAFQRENHGRSPGPGCTYLYAGETCGLPKESHPCAFPVERHSSETSLPDYAECYSHVIVAASAAEVESAIRKLLAGSDT